MALRVVINGQPRVFEDLAAGASVLDLIAALALKGDRVALELNGEIAARSAWGDTALADEDKVEIVHFVGGGSGVSVPFQTARITDVCVIVEDLERAMAFYRDLVGFKLRRHAPGFADFATEGVTLALWERRHLAEHVGIEGSGGGRGSMSAVEVDSPERVDEMHLELSSRGMSFLKAPRWYAWNAYACYFEDPDGHLWEIYAWGIEGHAGLLAIEE